MTATMLPWTALSPEDVPPRMTGVVAQGPRGTGWRQAFLPSPCIQNHAANLAFLADGTLTCVWFGGTMEGMGDISIYLSSLAPGADRWSEPAKMSEDPTRSEQNPLIFSAPDGRVWLLYTSQVSGNQDGAIIKCRISEDGGQSFGAPSILCDLPGIFVRQPIVVNGRGDWLLPVFLCRALPGERWSGDADKAGVLMSRDGGDTWLLAEVPGSLGAVHMNIVPLDDGRMVAFFRNRFATRVLVSRSSDDGMSWTAPEETSLPNNNSSIQAVHLGSGRIAIVYNHANAESSGERRVSLYDEIEQDEQHKQPAPAVNHPGPRAVWGVPRAPLSLAVTTDAGQSFERRIDLDTGDGYCLSNNSQQALNREFSYPSIAVGDDGSIHVAYTYFRRAIKYVHIPPGTLD